MIVGNWKMNQSLASIERFMTALAPALDANIATAWIAPQAIHLPVLLAYRQRWPKQLRVGAQNCASALSGAHTGEISPEALKELGVDFVIIGHSERRTLYGETDALLHEKVQMALGQGLTPIFCVGETQAEREAGQTMDVVERQVRHGLKNLQDEQWAQMVIAYEPVWAIGTGLTASAEQASEVHQYLRGLLRSFCPAQAEKIPLLYGGSVKPENLEELLKATDIDGALVGGASLKALDFAELLKISSCQA